MWGPEGPGSGIGNIHQELDGLAPDAEVRRGRDGNGIVAFDRTAGCRGVPVESDEVHQVQFVGWTPGYGWVVVECAEEFLGEGVGSSWSASVDLGDNQMEKRRVIPVVDDMSTPGGIACAVAVEVRQGDVGMVVAGVSVDRLQVQLAAVSSAPARVTDALVGF
ncbi:hypothetical protein GB937_005197 [Aspergillus fischeri]|nr:hypothetical protein GB937_005197 [Aspergillus fischeri]